MYRNLVHVIREYKEKKIIMAFDLRPELTSILAL